MDIGLDITGSLHGFGNPAIIIFIAFIVLGLAADYVYWKRNSYG